MRFSRRAAVFGGGTLLVTLLGAAGCREAPPASPYELTASIEDLMIGVLEPNADVIFESVGIFSDASGTVRREPRTDEEWAQVEHAALTLAEAANLLRMPGRAVARGGGNPPESEAVPELTPGQIRQRIDADPQQWIQQTDALLTQARRALEFARSRNVQGLFDVGGPIDEACESCHRVYWFPDAPQAP